MKPTRWKQIRTVFDQLVELDEAERASRLEALGATDPELRDAVSGLLRADADASRWVAGVAPPPGFTFNAPNIEHEAPVSPHEIQQAVGAAYHIERELSGAGMSHVYVAEERAFGRRVVVKVIRRELAQALSARRFQREIQVAARLQHPHVIPLISAGEAGGLLYYTMPFVDGETLRERLNREGELPIDQVVAVVRDVASALAYAHRHGVAHRDIKPENILLSDGGAVVADFGIAKAVRAAHDMEGKVSPSVITELGTALGTPRYMAPEQAAGDPATDHRADLYALGALAYEMLTGRPPFDDRSSREVMMAHAVEQPVPVDKRRPSTPAWLAALVMRCLEKRPADRPQSAQDLLDAVGGPSRVDARAETAVAEGTALRARTDRHRWLVAGIGVLGVATALALAKARGSRGEAKAVWFDLGLPDDVAPSADLATVALSPDGSVVAYIGVTPCARAYPVADFSRAERCGEALPSIVVRELDDLVPRRLSGTEGARCPSFSPDGQWIVFSTLRGLKKVPVRGGPPSVISDSLSLCAVWTDRNEIVFDVRRRDLFRVSANGGAISLLARGDTSKRLGLLLPSQALPGGEGVFITLSETWSVDWQLGYVSLSDGRITKLPRRTGFPEYRPHYAKGHLLFGRQEGTIVAAPFSLQTLRFIGPEARLLQDTILDFSVALNGSLAYLSSARRRFGLVAVSAQGKARLLGGSHEASGSLEATTPLDTAYYSWPRISPDGKRVALEMSTGPFSWDVWVYDLESHTLARLTSGFTGVRPSAWTHDGRSVVFVGLDSSSLDRPNRVVAQAWDGSSPPRDLMRLPFLVHDISMTTPHGYAAVSPYRAADIWIVPLDTPTAARPLLATSAVEREARMSRDGKLLAYTSNETGREEVYVRSLLGPAVILQVSADGAGQPVWGSDDGHLYYRGRAYMMRATITREPTLSIVRRDTLFRDVYERHNITNYDVFPNERELLMIRARPTKVNAAVLMNWPELLDQRSRSP